MNTKLVNTSIEILGKPYTIRCPEGEIASLQQAAEYLNEQMSAMQSSGKVINFERIAVITALNIASEYLESDQQKSILLAKLNQKMTQLQDKLDIALNHKLQTEFRYSSE